MSEIIRELLTGTLKVYCQDIDLELVQYIYGRDFRDSLETCGCYAVIDINSYFREFGVLPNIASIWVCGECDIDTNQWCQKTYEFHDTLGEVAMYNGTLLSVERFHCGIVPRGEEYLKTIENSYDSDNTSNNTTKDDEIADLILSLNL
jgi:hypothetical protein